LSLTERRSRCLEALTAPPGGTQALLEEVRARITQAEEDLKHALRWGWRPGSTAVHLVFVKRTPWEGLRFWLNTPSEYTSSAHKVRGGGDGRDASGPGRV
jgi:hypothetical protein